MRQENRSPTLAVPAAERKGAVKIIHPGRVIGLCPVRLIALITAAAIIASYFLLRENRRLMKIVSDGFVRPYHRLAGRLFSLVSFSAAEFFYALIILAVLVYLARAVWLLVRRGGRVECVFRTVVSLCTAAALFYAGFCVLWGIYYYAHSFSEELGIKEGPVHKQDLGTVTAWFANLANRYGDMVSRDEAGRFTADMDRIFDHSKTLYRAVAEKYPALDGPELRAKPMVFSKFMSWINFTGFFFPFTGEANLNIDSPACLLPATIAHELAHQRGVAGEDEANFIAVLACIEDGDPDFIYSAALLAYIYLGNALYAADYDAWLPVYSTLSEGVRADLSYNSSYWAQYESKVSEVSASVYTDLLHSYGEELGMQSYGACVDLLVAYYADTALNENP